MSSHIDPIKEDASQSDHSFSDFESQSFEQTNPDGFEDNRAESLQLKSLQAAANNSPQVMQLKALQAGANRGMVAKGGALQRKTAAPVQRKTSEAPLQLAKLAPAEAVRQANQKAGSELTNPRGARTDDWIQDSDKARTELLWKTQTTKGTRYYTSVSNTGGGDRRPP